MENREIHLPGDLRLIYKTGAGTAVHMSCPQSLPIHLFQDRGNFTRWQRPADMD
jgi:hypothetical protein